MRWSGQGCAHVDRAAGMPFLCLQCNVCIHVETSARQSIWWMLLLMLNPNAIRNQQTVVCFAAQVAHWMIMKWRIMKLARLMMSRCVCGDAFCKRCGCNVPKAPTLGWIALFISGLHPVTAWRCVQWCSFCAAQDENRCGSPCVLEGGKFMLKP